MDGYIEELWGGQEWSEAVLKNRRSIGKICAVKDIPGPQEEERNVKTCLLKELSCFLQDVNERFPLPARKETNVKL
jgi:hypothetical protein